MSQLPHGAQGWICLLPCTISVTSVQKVIRSRKHPRRLHYDLGEDDCVAERKWESVSMQPSKMNWVFVPVKDGHVHLVPPKEALEHFSKAFTEFEQSISTWKKCNFYTAKENLTHLKRLKQLDVFPCNVCFMADFSFVKAGWETELVWEKLN